jgi:Domain of unknown function (DUF6265)
MSSSRALTACMVVSMWCMSAAHAAAHAEDVAQLSWLSGCWQEDGAESGSIEIWLAPAGGTMLGVSRTVKAGKTVAYEFMRIDARSDGKLAFTAKPSSQAEATFPVLRIGKQEIVFENKAHDFPQRIIYRAATPTNLAARIEGTRNGKERGIDYSMTKVACP